MAWTTSHGKPSPSERPGDLFAKFHQPDAVVHLTLRIGTLELRLLASEWEALQRLAGRYEAKEIRL